MDNDEAREAELSRHREAIDALDLEILAKLSERAGHAKAIGALKAGSGANAYRPEREAQVLARLAARNPGPLSPDLVTGIFRRVLIPISVGVGLGGVSAICINYYLSGMLLDYQQGADRLHWMLPVAEILVEHDGFKRGVFQVIKFDGSPGVWETTVKMSIDVVNRLTRF